MSIKSVIFVTTNSQQARKLPRKSLRGFFIANFYNADIAALLFTVRGSQSPCPVVGWSRCISNAAFLLLAYQGDKEYISLTAFKRPNTTMRNNTVKGTPKGDSASAYAEIQQTIKSFFEDVSDSDNLEESLFEMFQSTLVAMADMGYDDKALIRFCWVYRRTSKFLSDLENSVTQKRQKSTNV